VSKYSWDDSNPPAKDLRPRILLKTWKIRLDYFYIFGAIATFVGLFVEDLGDRTTREFSLWIIAKGLSMAGVYYFWRFAKWILELRSDGAIALWVILLIGAAGGLVQTFCLDFFITLFNLNNNADIGIRLISSAIFAAIWLPAQSVTVLNFSKFRKLRQSLQEQLLEMEVIDLARKRLQVLNEEIINTQIGELVSRSSNTVNRQWEDAVSNKSNEKLPEITRALATDHLRVLAHEISDLKTHPSVGKHWWSIDERLSLTLFDAIMRSVRTRPLNPEWFVLVLIGTIELPLLRQQDWPVSFYVLILFAITTYLIHLLGFLLFKLSPKEAIFVNLAVFTANAIIPFQLIKFFPQYETNPRYPVAFAIILVIVTLSGHIAQAGLIRQEDLIGIEKETLEKIKSENAQVNLELARITRKWAQHIHGNVQSRLHAYSLVLEQAQLREDADGVERAIEEIRRTLLDLNAEQTQIYSDSLEKEVTAICDLWDGIINFRVNIDPAVKNLIDPKVSDITKGVSEAITNSVRHGSAENIEIEISLRNEILILKVQDDGLGFSEVKPGLGSSVFESTTQGNWNLVRDAFNQKTLLTLQFNLAVPRVGVEPTLGGF
jgi:signal transduction histidine kinase